jgi:crotonobetainyl-CoA:carnitine CoA-transferase CaiB-like acyl-CoA transferase
MVIILLLLILLAILYSSERGRELLVDIAMLPVRVILYPFTASTERREKMLIKKQEDEERNFRQNLNAEVSDLVQEKYLLKRHSSDIFEQVSLYQKFEKGEAHSSYLKPDVLSSADGNNRLYMIKPEKIDKLRNKK